MHACYSYSCHLNVPAVDYEGHAVGGNEDALLIEHSVNSFGPGGGGGDTERTKMKNQ
jgi:hypothetical protein